MQHVRQVLPAEGFRSRQAVPAAGNPVAVEFPPTLRRLDGAIDEPRPLPVARVAERRHLFRGEAPGLAEDRVDKVLAEFAERPGVESLGHAGNMLQGECDLLDRCLVHGAPPLLPPAPIGWAAD